MLRVVSGGEHHAQIGTQQLCLLGEFDPVLVGHDDVGEEYVDVLLREDAHGLEGARRDMHAAAMRFEESGEALAREVIVVDQQDRKRLRHLCRPTLASSEHGSLPGEGAM